MEQTRTVASLASIGALVFVCVAWDFVEGILESIRIVYIGYTSADVFLYRK